MSLVGPWLSTTSIKKKKEKITKKKQEELERGWKERNVRLKEMHLPKETFEQYLEWVYGKGNKTKQTVNSKSSSTLIGQNQTSPRIHDSNFKEGFIQKSIPAATISSKKDSVKGPCSSKSSPVYTGSKMIGIAQMHKSNAVPVFNDDEAKDISKMRR